MCHSSLEESKNQHSAADTQFLFFCRVLAELRIGNSAKFFSNLHLTKASHRHNISLAYRIECLVPISAQYKLTYSWSCRLSTNHSSFSPATHTLWVFKISIYVVGGALRIGRGEAVPFQHDDNVYDSCWQGTWSK